MSHVYRGEPIGRLLEHEFADGTVQSQTIDIYRITQATESELRLDERQAFFGTDIEELPFPIEHETVTFTPGFTSNLGTARHFGSYNWEEPGLVLHMDAETIPRLESVEYTLSYMDDTPGVLGRVETLATGEIRWAGIVVGLTKDGSVNRWRDAMEARATNPSYEDEAEMFSPVTNIDVGRSVSAVAAYPILDAPTKGTLNDMLVHYDDYTVGYGEGQKLEYMDPDEKALALREKLLDAVPVDPSMLSVVVLDGDMMRVSKDDAHFRDVFGLAATDAGVVRDPDHPSLRYDGGHVLGTPR